MFGEIKIIYNKDAAASAKPVYNAICVRNELGEYETLLLTENDLQKVRSRATKNPEDIISLAWFARAVLWAFKALRVL
jgi:hypothetical protein